MNVPSIYFFSKKIWRHIFPNPIVSLAERYPQYHFGPGTYGDLSVHSWGEGATLSVGSYTSIASGVKVFLGGEHRIDWVTTFPFNILWESAKHHKGHPKSKGDVFIGSDVWIGADALILSGVSIGDGAVIGARAIITNDVPPYAIVVGNPAKIIKFRFEQTIIDRLLAQKWWTWSETCLGKAVPDLLSNNIENFLEKAENGEYQ